jgi:hypothetical protein
MTRRGILWGGLALAACLLATEYLEARPGGGQSYSRGSSSGGSRSSGSSSSRSSGSSSSSSRSSSSTSSSGGSHYTGTAGEMPGWVALLIVATVGGVFLLAVGQGILNAIRDRRRGHGNNWDSRPRRAEPSSLTADDLRRTDPDFSVVLFEDFAYTLYAKAHRARHDPDALTSLAPYLGENARKELSRRPPVGVPMQAVVVGAMRPLHTWQAGDEHLVSLEYEANLTWDAGKGQRTEYVQERWRLARSATARTRPWTGARTLGCPSCGAPFESTADSRCASCGQVAENGRFDWYVKSTELWGTQAVPPALTGTVEERGTDAPTIRHPAVEVTLATLFREDPTQSLQGLHARLEAIFGELQGGWAAQDLRPVRPFVTDSLFQYLQYWVDAYRAQGLRNQVDGARVVRSEPAKVTRDAHYDAVTLRMWGTGADYTTDASGRVVGGRRDQERTYSEYWTLARGVAARGKPARTDKACPACAAPLDINMAGSCEHCGAHVTSGEFDWVLSKLEQDDSYEG